MTRHLRAASDVSARRRITRQISRNAATRISAMGKCTTATWSLPKVSSHGDEAAIIKLGEPIPIAPNPPPQTFKNGLRFRILPYCIPGVANDFVIDLVG